jgi:tetratricopeptide (TPR) repeat protein
VASWRIAALAGIMLLATGLRSWGLLSGELVWHPDEIFMVVFPLNLLSGDLNPHTFSYPSFHYYVLGSIYGLQFLVDLLLGNTDRLQSWVARRMLWEPELARDTARCLGVFYSAATLWVTALVAGRLRDRSAENQHATFAAVTSNEGLAAALLVSVNVLLVRQAPIAGTDTPLVFWSCCAVWASLRLLDGASFRLYVIAGAVVGVCAATKYPGASVAAAVLASHLLARRSILDRRLWIAGSVSLLTFLALAPYTLLDFETFRLSFLQQLQHAADGRWNVQHDTLFPITETLRHGWGTVIWSVWVLVCGWTLWRRSSRHLVVIVASISGYIAVSWGDLVFVRYVLPIVPLQAVLLGSGILLGCRRAAAFRGYQPRTVAPAAAALMLILTAWPAYGAWQVARLQSTEDTRSQARSWIDSHVPVGATICNYGGWAGDPQVRTYEDLWWRFSKFTQAYDGDRGSLSQAVEKEQAYFSFAVQNQNESQAVGSIRLIHARQCSHVILHEHTLAYSQLEPGLRERLVQEAQIVTVVDPGPSDGPSVYDEMDAYYIPISGWSVPRPGPRIEIWEVPQYKGQKKIHCATSILSRTLSLSASTRLSEGDAEGARAILEQAISLEPENTHAYDVLAQIERKEGNDSAAVMAYLSILDKSPESPPALKGLAQLSVGQGDHGQAARWYERARLQQPRDAKVLNNLAVSYRAVGRPDTARRLWEQAVRLQTGYADAHFNLGTSLFLDGAGVKALSSLMRAVELAPDRAKYHSNAASAHRAAGQPARAVELWVGALQADSSYVDAYFNLAFTIQYDLSDPARALPYWQSARRLSPADADVVMHGAQALLDLTRKNEAVAWLRMFLDSNPRHARRRDMEHTLETILAL